MQVNGTVMAVRDSSFAAKKTGEKIEMTYFDLYDVTAKLVPCEMRKDGMEIAEGARVIADVVNVKKLQWGTGMSFVVRNVRVMENARVVGDGGELPFSSASVPLSAKVGASVPPAPSAPPQTISGKR